jgi:hypothetical protein
MSLKIECPRCERVNAVDESSIGCYVRCEACQARFYVPVPPLDAGPARLFEPAAAGGAANGPGPTLNDVLRDTQEGHGALLKMLRKQDQFLSELHREIITLRRTAVAGVLLLVILVALSLLQFVPH